MTSEVKAIFRDGSKAGSVIAFPSEPPPTITFPIYRKPEFTSDMNQLTDWKKDSETYHIFRLTFPLAMAYPLFTWEAYFYEASTDPHYHPGDDWSPASPIKMKYRVMPWCNILHEFDQWWKQELWKHKPNCREYWVLRGCVAHQIEYGCWRLEEMGVLKRENAKEMFRRAMDFSNCVRSPN